MVTPALHYSISAFITSIAAFFFSGFIYFRAKNRELAKYFCLYISCIAYWCFFVFACTVVDDKRAAYILSCICHGGGVFIPVLFLHFVKILTRNNSRAIAMVINISYWIIGLLALSIIVAPRLFIADVVPKLSFYYFPTPGPLFYVWNIIFAILVTVSSALLVVEARKRKGYEQKRLMSFFTANTLGYLGGIGCFLPVYGVGVLPFPYGIWGVFLFVCGTFYAVLRYQLIYIEVFIKKTLVFAGIFSFFLGIFSFVSFLVTDVLGGMVSGPTRFMVFAAVAAFAAVVSHRLYVFLVEITDKYLFQKKFDYQKVLKDASKGMSQIQSLRHMLGLVIHFMTSRVRVKTAAIYLRTGKNDDFVLQQTRGYSIKHPNRIIKTESAIVRLFYATREALDRDRIEFLLHDTRLNKSRVSRATIREALRELEELEAWVCVPTFLGGVLKYFLILGEKKSGDHYSDPDLDLFYALAQESAIAIENARLYDEAVKKNYELQQINEQLNDASLKLQMALHDTEEANKKLKDTQAQLIHEQKMATLGRLASSVGHEVNNPLTILQMNVNRIVLKMRKEPNLHLKEVSDFFPKMESNINRIKAVVNTLTGLLKKHEKGKTEPLSLKIILEETLPLVQFQTYLDNLSGTEISFHIPSNIPLIMGDLERLQEVFLNIFINAFHSMAGKTDRKIDVKALADPIDPSRVIVQFHDNGHGMSEDVLRQVFNFRFTTKPEGKGSGLGLYMCKHIVELHGGTITVESEEGKGSIFTVRLPIYQEKQIVDDV